VRLESIFGTAAQQLQQDLLTGKARRAPASQARNTWTIARLFGRAMTAFQLRKAQCRPPKHAGAAMHGETIWTM
jgi:hypothetical protein